MSIGEAWQWGWDWLLTVPPLGLFFIGLLVLFAVKALYALLEEMVEVELEPERKREP